MTASPLAAHQTSSGAIATSADNPELSDPVGAGTAHRSGIEKRLAVRAVERRCHEAGTRRSPARHGRIDDVIDRRHPSRRVYRRGTRPR